MPVFPQKSCIYYAILISTVLASVSPAMIDGEKFKLDLEKIINEDLGVSKMQKYLDEEVSFVTEPVYASDTVNRLAGMLSLKFKSRIRAVKKLRDSIQDSYLHAADHESDYQGCGVMSYREYERAFSTQIGVNYTRLCLAGPPVRKGFVDALDLVSDSLEDSMKENVQDDPDLVWQYFGTKDGLMYIFPSTSSYYSLELNPLTRPWYASAVAPNAKDVIIITDYSASLRDKDLKSDALKATRNVLDTLTPNDRVGIISSSVEVTAKTVATSAGWQCCNFMMSVATPKNLNAVNQRLYAFGRYTRIDTAYDIKKALEKAFQMIKNTEEYSGKSGKRDKVILFVTHGFETWTGITESVMDTLRTLNGAQNNEWVILAYGIGERITSEAEIFLENMVKQTNYDKSKGEVTPGKYINTTNLPHSMGTYYNFFHQKMNEDDVIISVPHKDDLKSGVVVSMCAQVYKSGEITGVVCADSSPDDLFADVTYFRAGEMSYAFLVDGHGRIMTHPYAPKINYPKRNDPLIVKMTDLETQPDATEILNEMLNGRSGSKIITSTRILYEGIHDSVYYGYKLLTIKSNYTWRLISTTGFSVCVVIAEKDDITEIQPLSTVPAYFHYHRLDLYSEVAMCNHITRVSNKDNSTVKFGPECFLNPYQYSINGERKQDVQRYSAVMTGSTATNTLFKAGVREAVGVTEELDRIWRGSGDITTSRYITTQNGVYRELPGRRSAKNYEPKLQPWYFKAIAFKGQTAITPGVFNYNHVFGNAIIVVTLSKTLFDRRSTRENATEASIFGVMGIDITMYSLYNLLVSRFPLCATNVCFIIDTNGFLVIHNDTKTQNQQNVHITTQEQAIAYYLITNNYMVRTSCIGYEYKFEHFQWKIKIPRGEKVVTADFELHPVSDTNVIVGIKLHSENMLKNCCSTSLYNSSPDCRGCTCEGLCRTRSNTYQYCADVFDTSGNYPPPCISRLQSAYLTSFNREAEQKVAKTLAKCYNYHCSNYSREFDCNRQTACSWCSTGYYGTSLHEPYCGDFDMCSNYGKELKPADTGFSKIIVLIVGLVILTIIVTSVTVVCVRCIKMKENPGIQLTQF